MYSKIGFAVDAKTLLEEIDELANNFHKQIKAKCCVIFKVQSTLYWALKGYISVTNNRTFSVLKIVTDIYDIIDDFFYKDELANIVARKLWDSFDCAVKAEVESRLTCYIFLGGAIKPSTSECIKYVINHVSNVREYCYVS
jgi:hypothetical protein